MIKRANTPIFFVFLILFSVGCGFQGRKYTTGHYWESINKNEYEKRNGNEELKKNEKQKENGNGELKKIEKQKENEELNGNEELKEKTDFRKSLLIEHSSFEIGKISNANKINAVENQHETSEKPCKNHIPGYSAAADTIVPNEIPKQENSQKLNVDTTPLDIDTQNKAVNDRLLNTIALAVLLGGFLFVSLIAILFKIPELSPLSAILLIISNVIWIKSSIKLNQAYQKLAHALMPYKNENSDKKWYRKIESSMNSDKFIGIGLILGYIIFDYIFLSLLFQ